MGRWRTKLYKTDRARDFDHEQDRQVRARQVYETIDRQHFQWIVTIVAGIGFFLDGYTLFASNIAMPMIAYVYWNDDTSHDKLSSINMATLAGTMVGQVAFGILADQKGRKKMYGLELVVLIVSTLGVAMASTGTHSSMSIYAWLLAWRFIAGVGVGADYPLSAIITSEFAPTGQRARMLATAFFMQPLGQVTGNLASMAVVTVTRRTHGSADLVRTVDIMWRWVIGIGIVPGILALIFRLAIPETPRFVLEIQDDPVKAEFDATELFGDEADPGSAVSTASTQLENGLWKLDTSVALHRPVASVASTFCPSHSYCFEEEMSDFSPTSALDNADWTLTSAPLPNLNSKWSIIRADLHQYFIKEGNYITLLGTSLAWLLLDFGFYGIGLSTPHFLAKIWGDLRLHGPSPPWQINDDPSVSIYDQLIQSSLHALVILNLGSVIGSALLILTINRLNRVALQRYGFLLLAALFVAMGTDFITDPQLRGPTIIWLYVLAQAVFNFGPNATTYILPAEVFPTRYRATCHGISAAMGKLGSILVQVITKVAAHHGRKTLEQQELAGSLVHDERSGRYGRVLVGFAAAMILGFFVTFLIPQVQEPVTGARRLDNNDKTGKKAKKTVFQTVKTWPRRIVSEITTGLTGNLRSKTLEDLSLGRAGWKSASARVERRRSGNWI